MLPVPAVRFKISHAQGDAAAKNDAVSDILHFEKKHDVPESVPSMQPPGSILHSVRTLGLPGVVNFC